MAVLSQTVRDQIWRGLMRYWSAQLETVSGITKSDLAAAVAAADSWADTNSASFNTALPATFRTNASSTQKALLLAAVVLARFGGAGPLRSLLGEVD